MLGAILMHNGDMPQPLISAAELRRDVGVGSALLFGKVWAGPNELIDTFVMVDGLLLPFEAVDVVLLKAFRSLGVS